MEPIDKDKERVKELTELLLTNIMYLTSLLFPMLNSIS